MQPPLSFCILAQPGGILILRTPLFPLPMTILTGTFKDSGGALLNGELHVLLDTTLIDSSTSPDSILFPQKKIFNISNGDLNISLSQSETSNITYNFTVKTFETETIHYFDSGDIYVGPTHIYSDTYTYTGSTHSSDSIKLSVYENEIETIITSFSAVVPNQIAVEFSELVPTGITTDVLDTSCRRLADILAANNNFAALVASLM